MKLLIYFLVVMFPCWLIMEPPESNDIVGQTITESPPYFLFGYKQCNISLRWCSPDLNSVRRLEIVWDRSHSTISLSSTALYFRHYDINTTLSCYGHYHRWIVIELQMDQKHPAYGALLLLFWIQRVCDSFISVALFAAVIFLFLPQSSLVFSDRLSRSLNTHFFHFQDLVDDVFPHFKYV